MIKFIQNIFGPVPHCRDEVGGYISYCTPTGQSDQLELQRLGYGDLCEKADEGTTRICFFSDSHGLHGLINTLPSSIDLIIFCGDMAFKGRKISDEEGLGMLIDFNDWVKKIGIKTIVIGGNHDYHMEKIGKDRIKEILSNCIYLLNESVTINNINIYGTPYSAPKSLNRAFQDEETKNQAIADINSSHYDLVVSHSNEIYKWVKVRPKVGAFGHIHHMYGVYQRSTVESSQHSTVFICSSILDNSYCFANHPIVYDLRV